MFGASTYRIYLASDEDAVTLDRLAELDSQPPLVGRVLIGELGARPAAAISLDNGRVIADPSRSTDSLGAYLRVRADALRAYETAPSLRQRLLAGLTPAYRIRAAHVATAAPTNGHAKYERQRALAAR
jgi:hypothetical protein